MTHVKMMPNAKLLNLSQRWMCVLAVLGCSPRDSYAPQQVMLQAREVPGVCPQGTERVSKTNDGGFLASWCEQPGGLKHGPCSLRDPDDATSFKTGAYIRGQKHGLWINHSNSGADTVETWRNDARLRKEKWNPRGKKIQEEIFLSAAHEREFRWSEAGLLLKKGDWLDGQKHGVWRRWYPSGVLASERVYTHGEPDGMWLAWWPEGDARCETRYENGAVKDYARHERSSASPVKNVPKPRNGKKKKKKKRKKVKSTLPGSRGPSNQPDKACKVEERTLIIY